jgi:hypothetical protein
MSTRRIIVPVQSVHQIDEEIIIPLEEEAVYESSKMCSIRSLISILKSIVCQEVDCEVEDICI